MDNVQKALLSCSESLVLGHGHGSSSRETAAGPQDILMANLGHLLLKDVNDLGLFKSLRICSLPDNFITTIDALVECVHLVKLDLKGNQIVQLPEALFWSELGQLQLLSLHDNHVETIQNIQGLAGCPTLTGLTLYGTPFSLKADYRCSVVYSIWSLRALDHHVVSDQELANLNFTPKFKAFSPNLSVKLSGRSVPLDQYHSELKSIQEILSRIHRIQATYSPILVIQRWIRGHLTRIRLGLVKAGLQPKQKKSSGAALETTAEQTPQHSGVRECLGEEEMQRLVNHNVKPRRITLNLNKLMQAGLEVSQIEIPVEVKDRKEPMPKPPEHQRTDPPGSPEAVRGDVFRRSESDSAGRRPEVDPEARMFPLHCFKASLLNLQPLRAALPVRRKGYQDPHSAAQNLHCGRQNKPRLSVQHLGFCGCADSEADTGSERRWTIRPPGGIDGGQLLEARAETMRLKTEQVSRSLQWRQGARASRQSFLESHRLEAVLQGERDRTRVRAAIQQTGVVRDREVEDARRRHSAFLEEKKSAALERAMEREFSWRHAVVTKTVNKCLSQGAFLPTARGAREWTGPRVHKGQQNHTGNPSRDPNKDHEESDQIGCYHAGQPGQEQLLSDQKPKY